jgi:hypothetical protein
MPTFMLVPQTERFCLNIDLIFRAIYNVYNVAQHNLKTN